MTFDLDIWHSGSS